MTNPAFECAFNLLCHDKPIGSGAFREVFVCRLNNDWVVKVEKDHDWRNFQNVLEMNIWSEFREVKSVAQWLAPCRFMSPNGRILIQDRCAPLRADEMPNKLPAFLTDVKYENFGKLNGRVVCVDYGMVIMNLSTRLREVHV